MTYIPPIMATRTIHPELSSMALFRDALPKADPASAIADRLCAIGRFRALNKGEELVAQQEDNLLVFIATGAAKLLARSCRPASNTESGNSEQILAFHFTGDIVPVAKQGDGRICLGALSDLELIVFDTNQFLDTAQDEPAVIRAVLAKSLHALQRSRTKVVQMGHKAARQRVAGFLVSMADRLCGCAEGVCEFTLPMGRCDIAHSLGLTIETVSRQLSDLKHDGLLSTRGRPGIVLHDADALRREAGP